jgi:hypothetical protein
MSTLPGKVTWLVLGLLSACVTTIGGDEAAAGSGTSRGGAGGSRAGRGGSGTSSGGTSGDGGRESSGGRGGNTARPDGRAGGSRAVGGRGGAAASGTGGRSAETSLKPPCFACTNSEIACQEEPVAASGGRASALAAQLGKAHFLIGMGNDLDNDHSMDGAYTLGTRLDLHYAYLVGLPGMGGWPDWNADGTFVNILTDSAAANCVTPMYTVYSMATWGDGNLAGLSDGAYMSAYWSAAKLLFERLAVFDRPSVVHIEPDFWAYAAQQSNQNPSSMRVLIQSQAPDCAELPEDLIGMGRCWIKLARQYAPKALIGFHISQWASSPEDIIRFFQAIGSDDTDLVFMDLLDRDAGCFEAAQDPNCQRQGEFYWDETNQTSPNFHEYLRYAKQVSDALDKPILWWQIPFGVPSDTPGGTPEHYRDNRVNYIFGHIEEFIEAGGVGAAFGTGAANQTSWLTDGDRFKDAVNAYFQEPIALP